MAEMVYIDDNNYRSFINPVVDGEVKRCASYGMFEPVTGFSMPSFADQDKVKLIPQSEWKDRVSDRRRHQSTIKQACQDSGLYVLDQNGTNYCHSEDTEVLTSSGWVRWPDYNWEDDLATMNPISGMLEFQSPTARHIYQHSGEMICSTNKSVDFAVTPDHRMLVRKWDEQRRTLSDKLSFTRAADLGWYFGLPHATTGWIGADIKRISIPDDREYEGDDLVMLLSAVISDGFAGAAEKTRNLVSFCCFADDRYEQMAALAARTGFTEQPSRKGVFQRWSGGALAHWIRTHCYSGNTFRSHEKKIPQIVKEMSERQITIFLDNYGDQSHRLRRDKDCRDYFSTSRRVADDIQELLLRIGKRGSLYGGNVAPPAEITATGQIVTGKHPMWHVYQRSSQTLSIERNKQIERDQYDGLVYCATVPNSTLVTRRNGTVLISGNCWCNGVTFSLMVARLVETMTPVRYSPASVAAPVKSFRNNGGWGSEALDYMIENGINLESDWPANAINRSYYTADNREKAKQHRPLEFFRCEKWEEVVSAILSGVPVAVGYNWWGHLVCGIDLDEQLDLVIANSWGRNWSDDGYGLLKGNKKYPDMTSVAICSVTAV